MIASTARSLLALSFALTACGSPPANQSAASAQPEPSTDWDILPPPGYGTLRQDDFTVILSSGQVQVKVTPLHEGVIRLGAPDTYQRLHALVESRKDMIEEQARLTGSQDDPLVFLVSFFTYQLQERFEPTTLQILSQGILYRPVAILPLTPGWGQEQLKQQVSQSALYVFNPAIDLRVVFDVEYGGVRSFDWAAIVGLLEAERGKVLSRAAS